MTPQLKAFAVFLGVAGIVIFVFAFVARSTRKPHDIDYGAAYRLRKRFFFVMALSLLACLGFTLHRMPYAKTEQVPDKVVFVVAKQFAFGISDTAISNEDQWEDASSSTPVRIPAGGLVEFRVTSFDVNHGFAIYSSGGQLLAQTQAMPGYVNRLRVRLDQPGRYSVLCLELCGMEHHSMRGVFDVR
jgi:cytochrome c oxidase subunit 2